MWYFTWVLGIGFACGFGILNALWHEQNLPDDGIDGLRLDRDRAKS